MENWQKLPNVFKLQVISELDWKSRISLRQCSKHDLSLVNDFRIHLKSLEIAFTHSGSIYLRIEDDNARISKNLLEISNISFILKNSIIENFRIICPSSQSAQISEFISLLLSIPNSNSNFKIRAKNLYWRCTPPEESTDATDQFIKFLEFFDENLLELIHNDMDTFTKKQLERVVQLKQWKNAREISLANGEVENSVEAFFDVRNCTVYFKKLDGEDVWKMIQNFLSRDLPIGSSFDFHNETPPKSQEIFKAHGVTPHHQPIIPDDIGVEGRHTQRFRMATEGNFLVVKNTGMGIRGTVQKL